MKIQKLLYVTLFTLSTFVVGLQLGIPSKVQAAPGTCYQGPFENVARLAGCPDPVADGAARIRYMTDPVASSCYGSPGPVDMPYGTIRTFTEFPCADLERLEQNAAQALCTASGGTWGVEAGGGTPTNVCRCEAPNVYSTSTRQCGARPTTPAPDPSAPDPGVVVRDESRPSDCDVEVTGGELNGENCHIIGLLNTIFNFVSGGVALAVVGNIIFAGIQYSTAQGDPSTAAKSKNRIKGAILAFLMYVSLFAFIQWLIPGGVF